MNYLQESLYWITSGLLVPCVVFLLFMLIQSLMALGQYFSKRKHSAKAIDGFVQWSQLPNPLTVDIPKTVKNLDNLATFEKVIASKDVALTRLMISHFETETEKRLSRFSNFAKLGPITGLAGTLIPMGPALQGLADGNIQQLAQQMQIAFTTTVVGLIIGAIGFSLYQAHKRQSFKELALLDFILEKQETTYAK